MESGSNETANDAFAKLDVHGQILALAAMYTSSGKWEVGGSGESCGIMMTYLEECYKKGGYGLMSKAIQACVYFLVHGKKWLMLGSTGSGEKNNDPMLQRFFEILPKNEPEKVIEAQKDTTEGKMNRGDVLHNGVNISCTLKVAFFAIERASVGDQFMSSLATVQTYLKTNSQLGISKSVDHPEKSPILIRAKEVTKGDTDKDGNEVKNRHYTILYNQMSMFKSNLAYFDMNRYEAIFTGD